MERKTKKWFWITGGILGFILVIAILSSGGEQINQETRQQAQQSQEAAINQLIQEIQKQEELEQAQEESKPEVSLFKVIRVIDGDTIEIEGNQKIRYIGIDTPETVHPSKPVECFGKESSNKNKELVEGKMIRLEKDISETDQYGRLLRYVYVGDVFINDYLVRQGYANASTYPPDVKYSDQFVQAQQEAKDNNRGLWRACQFQSEPKPEPDPEPDPETIPSEDIICSYNAYNCSDFSTHAEAQRVYEYCGGVNNDIHGLDRDKDGLAYESLP